MIDPHVHCRDWHQGYKETIAHALYVAEKAGIAAIFDMPNSDPPLISRDVVKSRLEIAKRCNSKVRYGIYVGLTSDPAQIETAVKIYKEFFPSVVGLKMYAGHSVGNLAVSLEDDQRRVYEVLSELNYRGVLAVHCEKESRMKKELWDPDKPASHSHARPPEAEIDSIRDQILFAGESNYPGTLHIAHISHPDSVALINQERSNNSFEITCGVTPHHCILNDELMNSSDGLLYKVNPPLRTSENAAAMVKYLHDGIIDIIETDHAPHILREKTHPPYLSGFPGLPFVPHFLLYLRQQEFTEQEIITRSHNRACEIYKVEVPQMTMNVDYTLEREYEVDVYPQERKRIHAFANS